MMVRCFNTINQPYPRRSYIYREGESPKKPTFDYIIDFKCVGDWYEETEAAKEWCEENCVGLWNFRTSSINGFYFELEEDAVHFKMVCG